MKNHLKMIKVHQKVNKVILIKHKMKKQKMNVIIFINRVNKNYLIMKNKKFYIYKYKMKQKHISKHNARQKIIVFEIPNGKKIFYIKNYNNKK